MKAKTPILIPQQKAQILGDQSPRGAGILSPRAVIVATQIRRVVAQLEREKWRRSQNA
jgi:hypothetical protein